MPFGSVPRSIFTRMNYGNLVPRYGKRAYTRRAGKTIATSAPVVAAPPRSFMRPKGMYGGFGSRRPYFYKQTVQGLALDTTTNTLTTTITQTNAIQNYYVIFRLNQLAQVNTFASLYDQYMITKVVVRMMPVSQPSSVVGGVVSPSGGVLATAIDTDGSAVLSTLAQYMEYQTFRVQPATSNRRMVRIIVPQTRGSTVDTNSVVGTGAVKPRQWMDAGNTDVNHYGMHIYLDPYNSATNAQVYQLFVTYYVKFKNVR